jgi:hypothetical protein
MDCRKGEIVFVHHRWVINTQFTGEKLLQCYMKVMNKPGIIDDSGMVDVTEANFQFCTKSHFFLPWKYSELTLTMHS